MPTERAQARLAKEVTLIDANARGTVGDVVRKAEGGGEPAGRITVGRDKINFPVLSLTGQAAEPLPPRPGPVIPPTEKGGDLFPILGKKIGIQAPVPDAFGLGRSATRLLTRLLGGQKLPLLSAITCEGLTGAKRRLCLLRNIRTGIENLVLNVILSRFPVRVPRSTVTFVGPVPKVPTITRPGRVTPPVFLPAEAPTAVPGQAPPSKLPRLPQVPRIRPVIPASPVLPRIVESPGEPALPARLPAAPRPAKVPVSVPGPSVLPSKAPLPASIPKAKPKLRTGRIGLPKSSTLTRLGLGLGFLDLTRSLRRTRSRLAVPSLLDLVGSTSPVGSVQPFVSALAGPATSFRPLRQPAGTSARECLERRRKPGKCAEGFFKETPNRTRYKVWREYDCITGKVTKRSK